MGEEMFTTDEAGEQLGYPRRTISQYISRGLLKSIKRGRDHFIERSEIERFKQEHKRLNRKKLTTKND